MVFAISAKGQIVIPAELRKKHRIKPGSKVAVPSLHAREAEELEDLWGKAT